jgi:hypothetical protein
VAAAALLAAAALVGGCGGGGGTEPAWLAGTWAGSLGLSYDNGGGASGSLQVDLTQTEDFVSGTALWAPVGSTQSITGPVDGNEVTLLLHFRCVSGLRQEAKAETTTLTATFDGGETLTITGGSGMACPDGGAATAVAGASGALARAGNSQPL